MRGLIITLVAIITSVIIIYLTISAVVFPLRYKSEITAAAGEYNIDPALVAAVIKSESKFRPNAVSHKGAVGLMQIMPATAQFVADKYNLGGYDLFNPRDNIRIGTCYLRYLFDRFGDTRTVLAAYNAGEGNVARWGGAETPIRTTPYPETNKYIENVLNAKNFYAPKFV